ncbi:hypothetical protein L581_3043 [Serratia fonticola AU-AP2C]|nr:hypothetical protein L581_3043 [Serratia fonticola AU-AP2C]
MLAAYDAPIYTNIKSPIPINPLLILEDHAAGRHSRSFSVDVV